MVIPVLEIPYSTVPNQEPSRCQNLPILENDYPRLGMAFRGRELNPR
jgi:hypothetical protein